MPFCCYSNQERPHIFHSLVKLNPARKNTRIYLELAATNDISFTFTPMALARMLRIATVHSSKRRILIRNSCASCAIIRTSYASWARPLKLKLLDEEVGGTKRLVSSSNLLPAPFKEAIAVLNLKEFLILHKLLLFNFNRIINVGGMTILLLILNTIIMILCWVVVANYLSCLCSCIVCVLIFPPPYFIVMQSYILLNVFIVILLLLYIIII